MVFTILQWNAQSMNAHGPFLTHYISQLVSLPTIICIQETWFQPPYIFKIKGYNLVSQHHPEGTCRGGCAIYILDDICFHEVSLNIPQQSVGIMLNLLGKSYTIINLYSTETVWDLLPPHNTLQSINTPVIITGDFNSLNTYWGSNRTDTKGRMLLDFIENENLVLLNDGSGTRINPNGLLSPLDLTFVSPILSAASEWTVCPVSVEVITFPSLLLSIQ